MIVACMSSLTLAGIRTIPAQTQPIASRALQLITEKCSGCHGNNKPYKNLNLLDKAILGRVVRPGSLDSLLLRKVDTNEMPLDPDTFEPAPLTPGEKAILRDWILAGAEFPVAPQVNSEQQTSFIPDSAITTAIIRDLEAADTEDRRFYRYFSLVHLANANVRFIEPYRLALSKLLNSLSQSTEMALPKTIDGSKLILRIDTRLYQWPSAAWTSVVALYPYGLPIFGTERIRELSGAQIPFVRADWFVAKASTSPLYEEILGLPSTLKELEARLKIDSASAATTPNVFRAGMPSSNVSLNQRVVERHPLSSGGPGAYYWKSFDYANNTQTNIIADPLSLNPDGGEIIFSLPNGLQAYMIVDKTGKRLNVAPIEIVRNRNEPDDPIVRNGRSCMSCHYQGMQTFNDQVRGELLKLQERVQNGTAPKLTFNLAQGLRLYPDQADSDRVVARDSLRFRRAVDDAGSILGNSPQTEPINLLSKQFESELNSILAASELGLSVSDFQSRLKNSPKLQTLGIGALTTASGRVKRDKWESLFGEVAKEILNLSAFAGTSRLIEPTAGRPSQAALIRNINEHAKYIAIPYNIAGLLLIYDVVSVELTNCTLTFVDRRAWLQERAGSLHSSEFTQAVPLGSVTLTTSKDETYKDDTIFVISFTATAGAKIIPLTTKVTRSGEWPESFGAAGTTTSQMATVSLNFSSEAGQKVVLEELERFVSSCRQQ